jgi:hypothetical protein
MVIGRIMVKYFFSLLFFLFFLLSFVVASFDILLLMPFNGHHQLVDCSAIGMRM